MDETDSLLIGVADGAPHHLPLSRANRAARSLVRGILGGLFRGR